MIHCQQNHCVKLSCDKLESNGFIFIVTILDYQYLDVDGSNNLGMS